MKEAIIYLRNKGIRGIYKGIIKQIFFKIDPEKVHDNTLRLGKILGSNPITRLATRACFSYSNKILEQKILSIKFKNPIGLSAGFDKDGYLIDIIPSTGFGFEEVGSVTGERCDGNPKPRLWRLKKSKALVVYYGLKSEGCEAVAKRLKEKFNIKKCKIPIGISVAKTNSKLTASTEAGIKDYVKAYKAFAEIGDYTTINLSCPNAYGGQPFHNAKNLNLLLSKIRKIPSKKPIFLKIAPDLSEKQLDDIIKIAEKYKINGFVCTNLTKDRENLNIKNKILDENLPENGGISGKVVEELANKNISYIYKKTKGKFIIIGVGGVFSAEDAYKKIKLGASLIQLITGMVFEGPQTISEINQDLTKLLKRDGYKDISEAIGVENR
ncbi:quinone-dependent dihydroorotate dehydrogenase [Candidatus Pacearchaeota archaeon]|nr:quinone-dependent dihydroorotate dehydrogenase [Candidatus Pacearchaeota archaeon]